MVDYTRELYQQKKGELLMKVLKDFLGREPVTEDARRITIGTNPNWDYELISIDNKHVGRIVTEINLHNIVLTFNPETP